MGVNWTKLNLTLIGPLFEVTGRRKLDSLVNFRQKHMGIDTIWE